MTIDWPQVAFNINLANKILRKDCKRKNTTDIIKISILGSEFTWTIKPVEIAKKIEAGSTQRHATP